MAQFTVPATLTLTPKALQEIVRLGGVLRIGIAPGGCCGTVITFELAVQSGDFLEIHSGVTLALDLTLLPLLQNAKLDYGAKLKPPRFRLLHVPETVNRCACRRSFGEPFGGKPTPSCCAYQPMSWLKKA